MKKVIGFSNKYWTLWHVGEKYKHYFDQYNFEWRQDFSYIQNLSFDLEKAKAKIEGPYEIDENLKGESSWVWKAGETIDETPEHLFKFGKYRFGEISECTDFDYLRWYHRETENPVARERLVEMGCISKKQKLDDGTEFWQVWTPEEYANYKAQKRINDLEAGHVFTHGEKVELKVREVEHFGFMGTYGYTYVYTYETKCGKRVKYVGGSPNDSISGTKFTDIKATIKHADYQGVPETHLLRIKTLEK